MQRPSVPKVPGLHPLATLSICSAQLHVKVALTGYCPVKDGANGQSIGSTSLTPFSIFAVFTIGSLFARSNGLYRRVRGQRTSG